MFLDTFLSKNINEISLSKRNGKIIRVSLNVPVHIDLVRSGPVLCSSVYSGPVRSVPLLTNALPSTAGIV